MNLQSTLPLYSVLVALLINPVGAKPKKEGSSRAPNVLFIAVDDLNDWIGCLGGNPQVKTPNLDRFAKQAVVMRKAYCPSSVCCPSRSALLTGKHAANTGVYGNKQNLKDAPKAKDLVTLPDYFGKHGYHTLSAGKIFHKHGTKDGGIDEGQWAYHEHAKPGGNNKGPAWKEKPEAEGIVVNLIDMYPTLTTYNFKNHSVTDGRYRYTWYGGKAGGAEELYDHRSDPLEHTNLAGNAEYAKVIARLKKHLPEHNEPPSPENAFNELKKEGRGKNCGK